MSRPAEHLRLIAIECEAIAHARARSAAKLRARRRDRILMAWQSTGEGELNALQRLSVHLRDGRACVWCGERENLRVDHIHPVRHGGSNALGNLQTLCGSC